MPLHRRYAPRTAITAAVIVPICWINHSAPALQAAFGSLPTEQAHKERNQNPQRADCHEHGDGHRQLLQGSWALPIAPADAMSKATFRRLNIARNTPMPSVRKTPACSMKRRSRHKTKRERTDGGHINIVPRARVTGAMLTSNHVEPGAAQHITSASPTNGVLRPRSRRPV